MAENDIQNLNADARMQSLLATFRQIGVPLMQSVAEVSGSKEEGVSATVDPAQFTALIDSTIMLSRELAREIGAQEEDLDASVRWALAGSASQVVAASFRATGAPMKEEEAVRVAATAAELQTKFKSQIPAGGETAPNTVATLANVTDTSTINIETLLLTI